jgi:hypothetical protein
MPPINYRRRDLVVTVQGETASVRFENRNEAIAERISSPEHLAAGVTGTKLWSQWSSRLSRAASTLPRICLEIRDSDRAGESWEAPFVRARPDALGTSVVLRTSAVRPRCANFPFAAPLRILHVNSVGSQQLAALEHKHRGKSLTAYTDAFVLAGAQWSAWKQATSPGGWPNVDILHIEKAPTLTDDAMSGDPTRTGSLGWFVSLLVQWQVRLVVLQPAVSDSLAGMRRFAAAVVARGGPAVVVEAFADSHRQDFYTRFYQELIHDRPLDAMWYSALTCVSNMGDGTLFGGAAREEQLRISSLAHRLRPSAPAGTPARRVAKKSAKKKYRAAGKSSFGRPFRLPLFAFSALAGMNFQRESTFLRISKRIAKVRSTRGTTVSATDALGIRSTKAPRLCNASFWRDSAYGRLVRIDQRKGVFLPGMVYHLGIQIGPKDTGIVSVNAKSLVEEVFKWTPDIKGVWIEIGVTALDFDLLGDPVQRLWLPRQGVSEPMYFAVVPRKPGACRLRFSLYYEQNVIQSFRVAAVVSGHGKKRAKRLAAALNIANRKQWRDLVWLPVMEFSLASSIDSFATQVEKPRPRALSIVANKWGTESVISVKGASGFGVNLSGRLPLEVKDLRDLLHEIFGLNADRYPFNSSTNEGDPRQLESMLRALADQGSKLFAELFDGCDWKDLRNCLSQPDQIIQIAQVIREKVIPWNFVYGRALKPRPGDRDQEGKLVNMPVCLAGLPNDAGNLTTRECGVSPQCRLNSDRLPPEQVICPLQFWGFRHVIEVPPQQVLAQPGTSVTTEVRTEIEVCGSARLVAGLNASFDAEPEHSKEIGQLKGTIPLDPPELKYTAKEILECLAKMPIHIAYFFCHASGGKGKSDSMLIVQAPSGKQESIPWQDFAQLLDGDRWEPPALVFINGCRTAAYSPEALSPFLRAFVDQLGASGLIGTEVSVWDLFAAKFAEKFLLQFLSGRPAGQALLDTRRALLSKRNPFGLVYTLFAWSGLHLVTARSDPQSGALSIKT